MKIKTKEFTLSPGDKLPTVIKDPEELVITITKKLTINSKAINLNSTFLWVRMAEKILKRYPGIEEKYIYNLKYNLATVLFEKSDYNRSKKLVVNCIKYYSKECKINKRKLSECHWYMAMILLRLDEFENAQINILHAMKINKTSSNFLNTYAEILFKLGKDKEAKINFDKALEICILRKGKEHPSTASLLFSYGWFFLSIGKFDLAIDKMNKAYLIFKNTLGEKNLYTTRVIGHISNLLYMKKNYKEAFEKMKVAYEASKNTLGNDNQETITCKYNCAKILIKIKKYGSAIYYLDTPFAITDRKGKIILLAYNKITMKAPEVFIFKENSSFMKIQNIIERRKIPIIKSVILVENIMKDCSEFEAIPIKYWEAIAKILSKY